MTVINVSALGEREQRPTPGAAPSLCLVHARPVLCVDPKRAPQGAVTRGPLQVLGQDCSAQGYPGPKFGVFDHSKVFDLGQRVLVDIGHGVVRV